mgnify:CR=1 FL=1
MQSKTISKESPNILLLDSSISDNEFKNINNNFEKIITFDFESDRNLISKKISHEISDSIIDISELKLIDSACLNFCQWYEKNNGNETLSYENINLGSLFRVEFYNFLIPLIKNFLILKKLKTQYPDSTFYCSNELYKISKELDIKSIALNDKSIDTELTWDNIQFNLTRSVSLKISKKNYNKIKNISKIVSNLVIKKNYNKNLKNNFGFIEFDSIKYEEIFQESNNFNEMFLLYNRHRPVFYNRNSLKIIKNSKILPFIPSKNILKISKEMIEKLHKNILENFHQFLNNDEFFSSFFQLNNIKFWPFLKSTLIKIFESKILDSLYEIEYAKIFLEKNNLKAIVILSECGFTEQIIIKLAKKFSIKIILLQHGIIIDNTSSYNYNKIITGTLPIESDYFFSWGKISSEYIKKLDSTNADVKLIGSSNLDRIFSKKIKKIKKPKNILLLTTGPRNQQSVGHHVHIWNEYEQIIKTIYSSVSKHNFNLIIKRHPDIAENDFSPEFYSQFSDIEIFKNGDLSDLLVNSEFVISLGISSGILEAQILQKPVISINAEYDIFGSTKYIPNSCTHIQIEEFDKLFSKIVTNSSSSNDLIQKGTNSLNNNISNIGNSSHVLFDCLIEL